jgi:hypothetical protein
VVHSLSLWFLICDMSNTSSICSLSCRKSHIHRDRCDFPVVMEPLIVELPALLPCRSAREWRIPGRWTPSFPLLSGWFFGVLLMPSQGKEAPLCVVVTAQQHYVYWLFFFPVSSSHPHFFFLQSSPKSALKEPGLHLKLCFQIQTATVTP